MKSHANQNKATATAQSHPAQALPHSKLGVDERYIIIGNFRAAPDEMMDEGTGKASGVNITEFYGYMRAYARVHRLSVVDYLDDGIVLRGRAETMRKLAQDTDGYYSCVCVTDRIFNEMLRARGQECTQIGAF